MKIGDVAERLGMPASTIRYYEKVGLITQQRRVSGRRQFDERALMTLQFVRLAQAGGFSLAETKSLLESYAADPGPGGMWKPFAETKRQAVQQQIKELKQVDRVLSALLSCDCASLSECVERAEADPRFPEASA
jgi:DNA-binding transcriptional MerR regulator